MVEHSNPSPGSILLDARIRSGRTRKFVADLVGISSTHLYDIEEGRRRPSQENLAKLCEATGTPLDRMLDMYGMVDARLSRELSERPGVAKLVQLCIGLTDEEVAGIGALIDTCRPHARRVFREALEAAACSVESESDGEIA